LYQHNNALAEMSSGRFTPSRNESASEFSAFVQRQRGFLNVESFCDGAFPARVSEKLNSYSVLTAVLEIHDAALRQAATPRPQVLPANHPIARLFENEVMADDSEFQRRELSGARRRPFPLFSHHVPHFPSTAIGSGLRFKIELAEFQNLE
jgi:hypothetical protein